ncbi:PTS transporter subunit EIIC [Spiroplasma cantharicola]|uniref:PTS system, sucrose-specific IIB component n=1 Tax=Spiroplasma cantharicola TaxID=362837 RepID=A0A0M3SJC0_9MOLU|nr:PTS transporter subunit EIIC [Spiroplasma cantharicola]ALD66488.1 PTS system, sucrose-specific IIB component [Spiroplasma cantharicola]
MKKVNYAQEAEKFINAVGGRANIESYLHCVTRLRFNVIDKSKVNIGEIKSSPIAKGTNWTQNQLQIILGTGVVEATYSEVQKILEVNSKLDELDSISKSDSYEEFKLKAKANKEALRNSGGKFAWIQMSMKTLGDIFLPIIPAIVAAGLAMGFAALIKNLIPYDPESDSLLWIIVDIVTKTAFSSLAVLVCWSTVKRFGGNPVLGIIIGLMLINPLLPDKGLIAAYNAQSNFEANGGKQEEWIAAGLKWLDTPVTAKMVWIIPITGYQGSVLPALVVGIGVAYLEKFIKTWMPKSVNIIFTPFLTILIALLAALFILGPILLLVEQGVLIGTKSILAIPFGFGTGIVAGLLQAIVITGCHQVLQGLEMQLVIDGSIPQGVNAEVTGSIFNAIWTASIISQGGAAMAVALKTKSKQEKNLGMSSAVSTMFGITEPAIFGVNLPKIKPFIYASIGGFIGGFFAGLLNVTCPGMGVTVIPGLLLYSGDWVKLILIILVNIISFGSAFALVIFFYWEAGRKISQKQIDKQATKIVNKQIEIKNIQQNKDTKNYQLLINKAEKKLLSMKTKEKKLKEDKIKYEKYIEELKQIKQKEKEESKNNKLEKIKLKEEKKLKNKGV